MRCGGDAYANRCVDLMGHPGDQGAQRLHFLRLDQVLLHIFLVLQRFRQFFLGPLPVLHFLLQPIVRNQQRFIHRRQFFIHRGHFFVHGGQFLIQRIQFLRPFLHSSLERLIGFLQGVFRLGQPGNVDPDSGDIWLIVDG